MGRPEERFVASCNQAIGPSGLMRTRRWWSACSGSHTLRPVAGSSRKCDAAPVTEDSDKAQSGESAAPHQPAVEKFGAVAAKSLRDKIKAPQVSFPQIHALNESTHRQAAQWQQLHAELDRAREEADAAKQASLQREIDTLETSRSMLNLQRQMIEQQATLVQSSADQGVDVRNTKNLTIAVLVLTAIAVCIAVIALFV